MKLLRSLTKSLPLAAVGFFILLIFAPPAWAADINISGNIIWTAGQIHVIPAGSNVNIAAGSSLTIQRGAIIKLNKNSTLPVPGFAVIASRIMLKR